MADKSWKLLREGVRKVLWEAWDPIGVNDHAAAFTEYDSYAPGIVSLLIHGCSASELDLHLSRLETVEISLPSRPAGDRASAVASLIALRGERT